jgi:hypothetical protein
MYKLIKQGFILSFIVISVLFTLNYAVNAEVLEPMDFEDDYLEDRVCYAWTEVPYQWVAVTDTWKTPEPGDINVGTTSKTMSPCVPYDCPEGRALISDNMCVPEDQAEVLDPFAVTYREDRICYAWTEVPYEWVAVMDTWVPPTTPDEPNIGNTSKTMSPCVPTACPDGRTLTNNNVCAKPTLVSSTPSAPVAIMTAQAFSRMDVEDDMLPFVPVGAHVHIDFN